MKTLALVLAFYCVQYEVMARRARPLFSSEFNEPSRKSTNERQDLFARQLLGENVTRKSLLDLKKSFQNELQDEYGGQGEGQGQTIDVLRNTDDLTSGSQGQYSSRDISNFILMFFFIRL